MSGVECAAYSSLAAAAASAICLCGVSNLKRHVADAHHTLRGSSPHEVHCNGLEEAVVECSIDGKPEESLEISYNGEVLHAKRRGAHEPLLALGGTQVTVEGRSILVQHEPIASVKLLFASHNESRRWGGLLREASKLPPQHHRIEELRRVIVKQQLLISDLRKRAAKVPDLERHVAALGNKVAGLEKEVEETRHWRKRRQEGGGEEAEGQTATAATAAASGAGGSLLSALSTMEKFAGRVGSPRTTSEPSNDGAKAFPSSLEKRMADLQQNLQQAVQSASIKEEPKSMLRAPLGKPNGETEGTSSIQGLAPEQNVVFKSPLLQRLYASEASRQDQRVGQPTSDLREKLPLWDKKEPLDWDLNSQKGGLGKRFEAYEPLISPGRGSVEERTRPSAVPPASRFDRESGVNSNVDLRSQNSREMWFEEYIQTVSAANKPLQQVSSGGSASFPQQSSLFGGTRASSEAIRPPALSGPARTFGGVTGGRSDSSLPTTLRDLGNSRPSSSFSAFRSGLP